MLDVSGCLVNVDGNAQGAVVVKRSNVHRPRLVGLHAGVLSHHLAARAIVLAGQMDGGFYLLTLWVELHVPGDGVSLGPVDCCSRLDQCFRLVGDGVGGEVFAHGSIEVGTKLAAGGITIHVDSLVVGCYVDVYFTGHQELFLRCVALFSIERLYSIGAVVELVGRTLDVFVESLEANILLTTLLIHHSLYIIC